MKSKIKEILYRLIRHKNGMVVDSMADKNLNYERSYGVSVVKIKEVAGQYPKDNDLAMMLFNRPERECKLAAVFIADAANLSGEQIEAISKQIINSELAEQVAMRLMPEHAQAIDYALNWCKNTTNEFLQKCGWMIAGRLAALNNFQDKYFDDFFELLNQTNFGSIHLRSAIIYALPKLSQKSETGKNKTANWVAQNKNSNNTGKQIVACEIDAFSVN